MQWFLGTYTARYNRRHKLFGHLFSGRFKALTIDESSPGYLKTACDYVHLNPVRAKLIEAGQRVKSYGWSRYLKLILCSVSLKRENDFCSGIANPHHGPPQDCFDRPVLQINGADFQPFVSFAFMKSENGRRLRWLSDHEQGGCT